MIKSMSKEELLAKNPIFLEQVKEGFDNYFYVILHGEKVGMHKFFQLILADNVGESFVDFHYARLETEQQKWFVDRLNEAEKMCFQQLEIQKETIYYPLNEGNLEFFFEITVRELLFSTFYFTKQKATIWGNYNLEYPIFAQSKEVLEAYQKMAEECGLETK
ncbi:MAG: hypothetical protein PHX08_09545 [Lachnospiraceae bacterium]|nr:hypothetical protein [Lachnospiraceae bacterium]